MRKDRLDIIYEDKHLLIVNKSSKKLTISTDKEKENTLFHEVLIYLHKKNQKAFIVHRLDKDTSGLVLFAKTMNIKEDLQKNWNKSIRKYYGIVQGKIITSGLIESYLKETNTLLTYSTNDKQNGKYAKTIYKPIKNNNAYTLLDINIITGRKNQIRVHMKDIKHPLIGDKKYGATKNPLGRLGLHAYYLKFYHPILKKDIEVENKLPIDFDNIFKN